MEKSEILRDLIFNKDILIMPDAFDPITARMIEFEGFKAVQCSGYSYSISSAYPNENDVVLTDNLDFTRKIVESVDIPVMADGEDGYGTNNVSKTVKKFMDIGVAGINLEDQLLGVPGKLQVVGADLMSDKIISAREAAEIEGNHSFVINGRTDALKSVENQEEGLNLAIDRSNQYLMDGADITFITYVSSLEQVKHIMREVKGPVSIAAGMPYNIDAFSINDLRKCGVSRVSLPSLLILSTLKSLNDSLRHVKEDNMAQMSKDGFISNELLKKLLG